ncbi:MAG: DUF1800 family protein [Planctomycetaceae bacterium]|nr:MAG: DUF1800 family protein [Planctomycetaceae bacterium]
MTPQAAWAPYEPGTDGPWDLPRAAHLLRRAGFAADWSTLQQAIDDGPDKTIERLLRPPGDLSEFEATFDGYESAAATGGSTESIRAWWLRRMIETPYPLLEKMTLFWHHHFAISNDGVNNARLMVRSIHTLRQGSLGSYRQLLGHVIDDPALYLSLRSDRSRRSEPATNVADQLLGRFGVGPGHYDEHDLNAAARALTGRFVLRNELRFFAHEFDDGQKTLLGQQGAWDAEDAVRIVAQHPATAENIVRKLYAWLVADDVGGGREPNQLATKSDSTDRQIPTSQFLEPLVTRFHEQDDVGAIIEKILRSRHFFASAAYRRRIKTPVELAVGLARAMERSIPTMRLGQQLGELGQDLYRPPTSAGFPVGPDWINQATLIARWDLTANMLAESGSYEGRLNPATLAEKYQVDQPERVAQWLADLLLDGELPDPVRQSWQQRVTSDSFTAASIRQLAIELTQTSEYQLA